MGTSVDLISTVTPTIDFVLYSGNIIYYRLDDGACPGIGSPTPAALDHCLIWSNASTPYYFKPQLMVLEAGSAFLTGIEEDINVSADVHELPLNAGALFIGSAPTEIDVDPEPGDMELGYSGSPPVLESVTTISLCAYYGYIDEGSFLNGVVFDISLEVDDGEIGAGLYLPATETTSILVEGIPGAACNYGASLTGVQYTIYFPQQCGELLTTAPKGYYFGVDPFVYNTTIIPELETLKVVNEYGVSHRTMLLALGDYWNDYFPDMATLASISTGAEVLFSDVYDQLLEMVLASSIHHIPEIDKLKYSMVLFKENDFQIAYNELGEIGYYYIDIPNVESLEYLVSALFSPEVILRCGREFDIIDKELRFYVNLFDDPIITAHVYTLGVETDRSILMWATNMALTETTMYDRFGRFVYIDEPDSAGYKAIVAKMLEYYVTNKNISSIERILNILDGIPYTRSNDEQITSIRNVTDRHLLPTSILEVATQYEISTQYHTYYAPICATLLVSVGQVVPINTLIARIHKVDDYLTDPDWMDGAIFPMELIAGYNDIYYHIRSHSTGTAEESRLYDLMYNVLKYNIIYIFTTIDTNIYKGCGHKTCSVLPLIKDALPVYLYPLLDSNVL